jgi:hypothetical protein
MSSAALSSGLAYFDLPYVIMALIVVTGAYVERTLQAERTAVASPPAAAALEPTAAFVASSGSAR